MDMQCQALQHLAKRAQQLCLPRVCPIPSGDAFTVAALFDGTKRLLWLLTYVPGPVLAKVSPHTPELLRSLGEFLGVMDDALADFSHPAAHRELKWDLARAGWIRDYLHHIGDPERRELVERFLALYELEVMPVLKSLRRSVVYGDANDYNVLVSPPWPQPRKIVSVIDFGDMHLGITVSELAIAVAYAILGKGDPLSPACAVIAGYHSVFPLQESEIGLLYPLIAIRLAVSVTNSAHRKSLVADDPYITISEAPAWEALEKLARIDPRLALHSFRNACGLLALRHDNKARKSASPVAVSSGALPDLDSRTAPLANAEETLASRRALLGGISASRTRSRSKSCAAGCNTSTTTPVALISTSTTTSRSSATATRVWFVPSKIKSLSSTPTLAICTTTSSAMPNGSRFFCLIHCASAIS